MNQMLKKKESVIFYIWEDFNHAAFEGHHDFSPQIFFAAVVASFQ